MAPKEELNQGEFACLLMSSYHQCPSRSITSLDLAVSCLSTATTELRLIIGSYNVRYLALILRASSRGPKILLRQPFFRASRLPPALGPCISPPLSPLSCLSSPSPSSVALEMLVSACCSPRVATDRIGSDLQSDDDELICSLCCLLFVQGVSMRLPEPADLGKALQVRSTRTSEELREGLQTELEPEAAWQECSHA